MYLIFDTETTGVPHNKTALISDLENWPRLVQLAWQFHEFNSERKDSVKKINSDFHQIIFQVVKNQK